MSFHCAKRRLRRSDGGLGGDRLPSAPAAFGIAHVAGAHGELIAGPGGVHLRASPPRHRPGILYIAVQAAFGALRAQVEKFAAIAGSDVKAIRRCREACCLRCFDVRDVGVLAVLLHPIYAAAIAGCGQQAVRRPVQTVDHVIVRSPQLPRGSGGIEFIDLRPVGHQRVVVRSLHRSRRDDGDRRSDGDKPLDGQRRQIALALFAHRRDIDLSTRRFGTAP